MHILVIPSEEFVPEYAPLAGIFQRHQLAVLEEYGNYQLGVISVRLKHSIPMLLKAILRKLFKCSLNNELNSYNLNKLLLLFWHKLFVKYKFTNYSDLNGISVFSIEGLYYLPPSRNFDHYSWVSSGLYVFKEYCKKFGRPDIIHAHNALNAGLLAKKIKHKFNIPYVLTEHSSFYYQNLVPNQLYPKVSSAIEAASTFTVVSPCLKESLLSTVGKSALSAINVSNVLPPYFEKETVSREKIYKNNNVDFVFICVGNLLPIKGHEFLIRAFSEACIFHNNLKLVIVGDGPLRSSLESLASYLKIQENVSFKGKIDPEFVRPYMMSADAFVFPSQYETFGVALIEAMSCGLPVIATACGGPNEIVNHESGILVKSEDIEGMTKGLVKLYENRQYYDADIIRGNVISRFGAKQFYHQINSIYQSIYKHDQSESQEL